MSGRAKKAGRRTRRRQLSKPDWSYWRNVPRAKVWEAVALSCDVEPRETDEKILSHGPAKTLDGHLLQSWDGHDEYEKRREIALQNLGPKGPLFESHGHRFDLDESIEEVLGPRFSKIDLPQFVRWSQEKQSPPWSIPEELRSMMASHGRSPLASPNYRGGLRPADWNTYRYIPEVTLQDAVALSCDIDPEQLDRSRVHVPGLVTDSRCPPEFKRRRKIAEANCGSRGAIPTIRFATTRSLSTVRLCDFAVWAKSLDWWMPDHLADMKPLAPSEKPRAAQGAVFEQEKALGNREKATLHKVIAALIQRGLKRDLSDRGLARDIEMMTNAIGHGVSDDTVRKILTDAKEYEQRESPKDS